MKRGILLSLVLASSLAVPSGAALAQRETDAGVDVEKDIALLRKNLRAEKKKIIAAYVSLTETEAT